MVLALEKIRLTESLKHDINSEEEEEEDGGTWEDLRYMQYAFWPIFQKTNTARSTYIFPSVSL